jgi:hypothetical protein
LRQRRRLRPSLIDPRIGRRPKEIRNSFRSEGGVVSRQLRRHFARPVYPRQETSRAIARTAAYGLQRLFRLAKLVSSKISILRRQSWVDSGHGDVECIWAAKPPIPDSPSRAQISLIHTTAVRAIRYMRGPPLAPRRHRKCREVFKLGSAAWRLGHQPHFRGLLRLSST